MSKLSFDICCIYQVAFENTKMVLTTQPKASTIGKAKVRQKQEGAFLGQIFGEKIWPDMAGKFDFNKFSGGVLSKERPIIRKLGLVW
jgi:hypothetical protein